MYKNAEKKKEKSNHITSNVTMAQTVEKEARARIEPATCREAMLYRMSRFVPSRNYHYQYNTKLLIIAYKIEEFLTILQIVTKISKALN